MKKPQIVAIVAVVLGLIVIYNAAYTVGQAQQAVLGLRGSGRV